MVFEGFVNCHALELLVLPDTERSNEKLQTRRLRLVRFVRLDTDLHSLRLEIWRRFWFVSDLFHMFSISFLDTRKYKTLQNHGGRERDIDRLNMTKTYKTMLTDCWSLAVRTRCDFLDQKRLTRGTWSTDQLNGNPCG